MRVEFLSVFPSRPSEVSTGDPSTRPRASLTIVRLRDATRRPVVVRFETDDASGVVGATDRPRSPRSIDRDRDRRSIDRPRSTSIDRSIVFTRSLDRSTASDLMERPTDLSSPPPSRARDARDASRRRGRVARASRERDRANEGGARGRRLSRARARARVKRRSEKTRRRARRTRSSSRRRVDRRRRASRERRAIERGIRRSRIAEAWERVG